MLIQITHHNEQGGVSECRNPSLQTMFLMIGGDEKAGLGIDKIRTGWASQNLQPPRIEETTRPDRVRFILPTVSLLPDEALEKLRRQFKEVFPALNATEVQALVIAEQEGEVSNRRLRLASADHASDLTRLLQGLVAKGVLEQVGQKRGTSYRLSRNLRIDSTQIVGNSTQIAGNSTQIAGNSTQIADRTPHIAASDSAEVDPVLLAVAEPARLKRKLPKEQMRELICCLCRDQFLTPRQLGELLDRQPIGLQQNYVREMVHSGQLQLRFPDKPNHPNQAYTTQPAENDL